MEVINTQQKLNLIKEYWDPHVVATLNHQDVKLVKLKGDFIWHRHDQEDELFYVINGTLTMHFRDKVEVIRAGEMIVVPRGVDHKPVAEEEVHVMLFEPMGTSNTGNVNHKLTRHQLKNL